MLTDSRDKAFSDPHPVLEATYKGKKFIYAVLDSRIAKRLGLDEESCRFEQTIADNGDIILRLKRKSAA